MEPSDCNVWYDEGPGPAEAAAANPAFAAAVAAQLRAAMGAPDEPEMDTAAMVSAAVECAEPAAAPHAPTESAAAVLESAAERLLDNRREPLLDNNREPTTDPVADEEIVDSEIMAEAAKIVESASADDRDGLKDIQRLHLSMGVPPAAALLSLVFAHSLAPPNVKKDGKAIVAELQKQVPVPGCFSFPLAGIDISRDGKADPAAADEPKGIVYMRLDRCEKSHSLVDQLNKIIPPGDPASWTHNAQLYWRRVLQMCSQLLWFARSTYTRIAKIEGTAAEIRREYRLAADADIERYSQTVVDLTNSTIYVDAPGAEEWAHRIGIFVYTTEEINAMLALEKKAMEKKKQKKQK